MSSFDVNLTSSLDAIPNEGLDLDGNGQKIEAFSLDDIVDDEVESVLEQDLQELDCGCTREDIALCELDPITPDIVLSPEEVQEFIDSETDPDVLRGLKAGIESGTIGVEFEEEPDDDEYRLSLSMR